ncbi:MAG: MarR family transcriptional regulator [Clostridium lundense]|nr:MarR family transcriptional regulator [Clostridium lundense]
MKLNLYGHKVNQLGRYFTKRLNEKISPLGLYTSQWGIILYLYEKGQCTQVELGKYLCVEAPTITRTLTRMEEVGWIIREEGNDKRERRIQLTKKAFEAFSQWHKVSNDLEMDAIRDISQEELKIFNNVLKKMIKNLE